MSESNQTKKLGRRDFLKAAGMAAGGALLAACAPQAPQTQQAPAAAAGDATKAPNSAPAAPGAVKLRGAGSMSIDIINKLIGAIQPNLQSKNIQLEINAISFGNWSEYADKIVTMIAGGEQLDLLMIAIEGLPLLGSKGILSDLEQYLTVDPATEKMIKEDIHKSLTDMLRYKGKLLEIPFSWNNMVTYYNTKIMKEAGIQMPNKMNWDDFLQICKQIAKVKGGADDRYAYSFWGANFFGMEAWLYQNDGQGFLTDDLANSNCTNPKVLETLQYLADLILVHKVSPNPSGWSESDQFVAGNLGMLTCGRWCTESMIKNGFKDFDVVYTPHKSGPIVTVAGTDGWGVATKSKNPNEAFFACKELSGPASAMEMIKMGGNIPALRSVAEKPEFLTTGPANSKIFYESLDGAKAVQAPTNFNIIEPLVNRFLTPIWSGEQKVEEAMKACDKELQAEMDKIKG